jgi:quercetin dioxygenase-like cupin family protein
MKIEKKSIQFEDERGIISDILENEPIEYVTIISSNKGAIRGNHYHKESIQFLYLLNGKIKVFTKMKDDPVETATLNSGELIISPPNEIHAFIALENSKFIVCTRGPRGGNNYENDTFRVPKITPSNSK